MRRRSVELTVGAWTPAPRRVFDSLVEVESIDGWWVDHHTVGVRAGDAPRVRQLIGYVDDPRSPAGEAPPLPPDGPDALFVPALAATLGHRLWGSLVDSLVFMVPIAVCHRALDRTGSAIAVTVLAALYATVLVARTGQTIGNRSARARVLVRGTNTIPGYGRAAIRWLVTASPAIGYCFGDAAAVVGVAVNLAIYLPLLADPDHRGLHDRVAGVWVVDDRRFRVAAPAPERAEGAGHADA